MIPLRKHPFPLVRCERSAKERLGHRVNGGKPGAAQSERRHIGKDGVLGDEGGYREYEVPKAQVERDGKGGNASVGMISHACF